jgi:hypothetical protein
VQKLTNMSDLSMLMIFKIDNLYHPHEGDPMRFSNNNCPIKFIILFLMFTAHLTAQWSTDPTVNNAISIATNNQAFPQIVSDGTGGAIITWDDYRSGTSHDIYAQRINASGAVLWTADGVAISIEAHNQASPTIVSDGVSGAIITWSDVRNGNSDIYAQRINASGVVQWTPDGVAICTASSIQSYPTIVSDGSAGAIITWQDNRSGNYDIYARRIDATGAVQWTADGVAISTTANDQTSPTIVSDGAGGAIITWTDFRSGTNYDIYAQRINGAGAVQWTANGNVISTAAGNQTSPTIVSNGASGAIITWVDLRNGNNDIYAQRINADSTVQWTADGVAICIAAGYQYTPTLVSDGAGGAIITWYDLRSGLDYDIYARLINAAGVAQWTTDGVAICTATGYQTLQNIVSDGAGGAIITWIDARGSTDDIYAQHITAAGAVPWTANGVAIATAAHNQYAPTLVSDGAGGAIITWHDYRTGSFSDIYSSKIGSGGVLPIELTLFSASSKLNGVELKWKTAIEINNYGFEIEKTVVSDQSSGISWKKIDFVEGNGTTNVPKEYTYIDKNIEAGNYSYRLKQIDRDGQFKYSQTVEVNMSSVTPKVFDLRQNYPNPFNPSTVISYQLPTTNHVSLKVYDVIGREVATLVNEVKEAGYYSATFDASSLSSGLYFSRLEFDGRHKMGKMLLIK